MIFLCPGTISARKLTTRPGFGAGGIGILREEVWVNEEGEVVKYNLALLLPHQFGKDNGRVLGLDNAHGVHERHHMGEAEPVQFKGYLATAEQFFREAEAIRRSYGS